MANRRLCYLLHPVCPTILLYHLLNPFSLPFEHLNPKIVPLHYLLGYFIRPLARLAHRPRMYGLTPSPRSHAYRLRSLSEPGPRRTRIERRRRGSIRRSTLRIKSYLRRMNRLAHSAQLVPPKKPDRPYQEQTD